MFKFLNRKEVTHMDNKLIANVQILWGAEGIKRAYEMTLKADRLDIVCLSSDYQKVIGVYFDKQYAPKLFNSSVKTREILPDRSENREDSAKKDPRKNQVKFLQLLGKSESDYMLFADKAVLVSYNSQIPFAVIVEDKDIAANLKAQFEALWSGLK